MAEDSEAHEERGRFNRPELSRMPAITTYDPEAQPAEEVPKPQKRGWRDRLSGIFGKGSESGVPSDPEQRAAVKGERTPAQEANLLFLETEVLRREQQERSMGRPGHPDFRELTDAEIRSAISITDGRLASMIKSGVLDFKNDKDETLRGLNKALVKRGDSAALDALNEYYRGPVRFESGKSAQSDPTVEVPGFMVPGNRGYEAYMRAVEQYRDEKFGRRFGSGDKGKAGKAL